MPTLIRLCYSLAILKELRSIKEAREFIKTTAFNTCDVAFFKTFE